MSGPRLNVFVWAAALALPAWGWTQSASERPEGTMEARALPKPEAVRPPIDATLPDYKAPANVDVSGNVRGACTENTVSLVQAWAEAFHKRHPNAIVAVPPSYGVGVASLKLIDGQVDFALLSREMPETAAQDFANKYRYPPLMILVSGGSYRHVGFTDAMAVIVNKENPLSRITLDQLDAIYSKSRFRGHPRAIKEWGDLGLTGEWADKPIHAWGLNLGNGMMEFMHQRVTFGGIYAGAWTNDLQVEDLAASVVKRVAADRYAIGYAGFGYLDDEVKALAIAEHEGGPYSAGSYEDVWRNQYALARVVYIVLRVRAHPLDKAENAPQQPLNSVVAEFIRFILSKQGQQVVLDHGVFLPLRAAQLKDSRELLEKAVLGK